MSNAAHPIVVEVATPADAAYAEVDGIKSLKFGPSRTMLETTDFKDTSGAKTRMAGLKDGTIELSGDLEEADVNGQNVIRGCWDSGAACWLQMKFAPTAAAGSQGYKVNGIVASYDMNADVDGLVTWSASVQFNGAPVAI